MGLPDLLAFPVAKAEARSTLKIFIKLDKFSLKKKTSQLPYCFCFLSQQQNVHLTNFLN